jgi:hypothetical protein
VAIIDPDGLFGGERLRRCSDEAQLHWPRFYVASNGYARLEINYEKIVARVYASFTNPPSEDEILKWIKEYRDNYLLFLYEVDGRVWGQWDVRQNLLPRHKTAADNRSPFPPEPEWTNWLKRYRAESTSFPKLSEIFGEFPTGVGVGVGVGGGVGGGKNIAKPRVNGAYRKPPEESKEIGYPML